MKKINLLFLALVLATSLNSCQIIGGIFKAGFVTAIIVVVVVLLILAWIISAFRGKN